jgi:hypothetical protein
MKTARLLVPVAVLLLLTALPASAAAPPLEGVPRFGNVFVVIGENEELVQINHKTMPYLVDTLRPRSAFLDRFFGVSHFSTSGYVGMTSGQYTPCEQFDIAPSTCHQDVDNLFHQVTESGASWTEWMESMPEPCYLTNAGSPKELNYYTVKHNPAVYYDNIEGVGGVWSSTDRSDLCLDNVIPTGGTGPNDTSALDAALASGDVADFNFIVPNMCEDSHDQCPGRPGPPINQFDDFLAREVPKILASPAFGNDGVLIVTFDEGTTTTGGFPSNDSTPCKAWDTCPHPFDGGGNIAFLVISPLADPGVYHTRASLYSLLRTLEDGFGITDYLGAADTARPIDEIWK